MWVECQLLVVHGGGSVEFQMSREPRVAVRRVLEFGGLTDVGMVKALTLPSRRWN